MKAAASTLTDSAAWEEKNNLGEFIFEITFVDKNFVRLQFSGESVDAVGVKRGNDERLSPALVQFEKKWNCAWERLLPCAFECASIGFAIVSRSGGSVCAPPSPGGGGMKATATLEYEFFDTILGFRPQ